MTNIFDRWMDGWMDGWMYACMHACMQPTLRAITQGKTESYFKIKRGGTFGHYNRKIW